MTATAPPQARPEKKPPRRGTTRVATAARAVPRHRLSVQRVDLWSVLKLALAFYLSVVLLVLVAGVVTWTTLARAGVIDNLESFLGELLSSNDFQLLSGEILQGGVLISLVLVVLLVILTVVAAALFNVFSELLGGLEIVVEEEPPDGR